MKQMPNVTHLVSCYTVRHRTYGFWFDHNWTHNTEHYAPEIVCSIKKKKHKKNRTKQTEHQSKTKTQAQSAVLVPTRNQPNEPTAS